MNRFAFLSTSFALKRLYKFSNARTAISGAEQIPEGPVIFTVNHFTRIETLFLPYHVEEITGRPVWSLAHHSLFTGAMAGFMEKGGAVSTRDPERDKLIIHKLLTGDANWIIFPEGSMVKNKKVFDGEQFVIENGEGTGRPRTGAANLALRAEFYRQRILRLQEQDPAGAKALCETFGIAQIGDVLKAPTRIVPVNVTYFPLRARENALNRLAAFLVDALPQRVNEELMTEGSMLLDGVDVDICFGKPIEVTPYLSDPEIRKDIETKRSFGTDDQIASVDKLRVAAFDLMETFMTAIYAMTTVNPDHLFATILREMPNDGIDPEDLKRRVYLAATLRLDPDRLFLHKSLKRTQVHLITDDRFGRYHDFIRYAKETGVVTVEDSGMLQRNRDKFRVDYGFHDIRVANPIAVMANEIEPLSILRPHLARLAKEQAFHIERRLIAHLTERGVRSYEEAKSRFRPQLPGQEKEAGRPFLLEGDSRRCGVLLIHGYLGAPAQMRELASVLQKAGFWVYTMRLPGHGTSPQELVHVTREDWEDAVLEAYALMHTLCEKVVGVGFSLGAVLLTRLCAHLPKLCGVCLAAAPVRMEDYSGRYASSKDVWGRILSKIRIAKNKQPMIAYAAEDPGFSYTAHPEGALREVDLLLDETRPLLGELTVPTLILQSVADPMVDEKAARMIFDHIGATQKEIYLLNVEKHGILSGEKSRRIHRMIADFIREAAGDAG